MALPPNPDESREGSEVAPSPVEPRSPSPEDSQSQPSPPLGPAPGVDVPSSGSPSESRASTLPAGQSADGTNEPFRKRPIYRDFDLLQLAFIFFLLDQLTKFLVRAYLPFGHSYPATGFFRFTHAENTGSAFGILQGHNTPLIVVSFVGIAVLALVYHSQERPSNLLRLSLALQFGGALGNLLDRFRLGAVTDFIDVGAWPIFNLADASIVSGLALLGWVLLMPGGRGEAVTAGEPAYNYQLKRRGRCASCGRYRAGSRAACRHVAAHRADSRHIRRRAHRR